MTLIEQIDRKIERYEVAAVESIRESNAQHWRDEKKPWFALKCAVEALEKVAPKTEPAYLQAAIADQALDEISRLLLEGE